MTTSPKITARIEKDTHGLFIYIDNENDAITNVAYAVEEDELKPIRDAIDNYLKQKEA